MRVSKKILFLIAGLSLLLYIPLTEGIEANLEKVVVKIIVGGDIIGTGTIIRVEGRSAYILTAFHVVEPNPFAIKVVFHQNRLREFEAKVWKYSDKNDIAILKVDDLSEDIYEFPLLVIYLGDSSKVRKEDRVKAIGHNILGMKEWLITSDEVSLATMLEIVFPASMISIGNSGGPLFNEDGLMIGMVSKIEGNNGFAVGTELIKLFLKDWGINPSLSMLAMASFPSSAEVYLEDRKRGRTPFYIFLSPDKSYKVRLSKEGYEDRVIEVELKAYKSTTLEVKLEERKLGSLFVSSEPSEAEVYLRGKFIGITPLFLGEELEPDEYEIRIRKDGYETDSRIVPISGGERAELKFELKPLYGSLSITSDPPEADVYLNRRYMGITPLEIEELKAGDYEVQVMKSGYEDQVKTASIEAGERGELNFKLEEAIPGFSEK